MSSLFHDQSRWNEYGSKELMDIQTNSDQYMIVNSPIGHWAFHDDLLGHILPIQGRSILELGCGLGKFSVYLSKLGGNVTGVDIGGSIICAARALAKVNEAGCKFYNCNVLDLPFDDNSYDVVIGISILHHLSKTDVISTLHEAYRVLKCNGYAIFVEPVENSKLFNTLQNIFPLGKPGTWGYRPSVLQRKKWKSYIKALDDRDMTFQELKLAGCNLFSSTQIEAYGFLSRLQRLLGPKYRSKLISIDKFLFKYFPPLQFYSQMVLVKYCK